MKQGEPNFPLLDLDILRTFVAICETGNFSRAADRVHRTPSAVSLQIKKLEEMVGRELFVREARSTVLTRDGEMLLIYARKILQLNEDTVRIFRAPPIAGRVRFGAPDDAGTAAIADVMQRFAVTHPDVELEVRLEPSSALHQMYDDKKLDVILFVAGHEGRPSAKPIYSEELVWVTKRNFQLPENAPLPLALADRGCSWRAMATTALDQAGYEYRCAYTSPNCRAQLVAVEAGLAIGVVPLSIVPQTCTILDTQLPEVGSYILYIQQQFDASDAVAAFHSHLVSSFQTLPGQYKRLFG